MVEKEAETERKKSTIEAQMLSDVSRINMDKVRVIPQERGGGAVPSRPALLPYTLRAWVLSSFVVCFTGGHTVRNHSP